MNPEYLQRLRITNELGQLQSAPSAPESFSLSGTGEQILFIGLGPDPELAWQACLAQLSLKSPKTTKVFYLEAPSFASQAGPEWEKRIPNTWTKISLEEFQTFNLNDFSVSFYKPGLKLFPSFYGPLKAKIQATSFNFPISKNLQKKPRVLLVGNEQGLLIKEIIDALKTLGIESELIGPEQISSSLPELLRRNRPDLFLSINFAGFDPLGELFYLLRELDISLASWIVDNPWHILSGLRASFWKDMHLFVTDSSFLPALKQAGAKHISHLPLATNPDLFKQKNQEPELDLVFAGRSQFPNRDQFFAAAKLDQKLVDTAIEATKNGERRDFNWWTKELGINSLWPGPEIRKVGLGAEYCSLAWRASCIRQALNSCLHFKLFGNPEWLEELPELQEKLLPPVDYYTTLPLVYSNASLVLSTTSLLLPAGLNQRHFDAWMAGSICLSDNTKGLEIFPSELVEPIVYKNQKDIPQVANELLSNKSLQLELKNNWNELLIAEHTYVHRLKSILQATSCQC